MTEQRLSQLEQAREKAYRDGDAEAEAWYVKEIEQLKKEMSEND